jgi:putative ABC transport system permease protein
VTLGVARLWVLAALRRPLRAVVIVVALAAMSVATVGSLVAADSLSRLFTADAEAEWGTVDVEGHGSRGAVFDDSLGRFLVTKAGPLAAAGAPRLLLPCAVRSATGSLHGNALGLGPEDQAFPPLVPHRGASDVLAVRSSEVLVNDRLARRLVVDVGDDLTVVCAVPEWQEVRSDSASPLTHPPYTATLTVRIAGVVADSGTADLHRTPNVLFTRSVLQRAAQLEPAKSTVLDLRTPVGGRDAAKALIDELDPVARRAGVALQPVKADALDLAASEGGLFRSLLFVLAFLVVAAAVGGAVNLMLSLVRERGTELAHLRAAGAPRSLLQRVVVAESFVYGVVGTAAGGVLALPFADALAGALADHLASLNAGRGREQVRLSSTVRPATVIVGALLVLAAACWAGRSAARRALAADPDVLLRGGVETPAPEPRGGARPAVALALGAAALGAGGSGGGALVYLGLTLLLVSAWLWRRRVTGDRSVLDRRWAVVGLVWSVAGAALLGDFSQGVQSGFGVIAVAGEVAVLCSCLLLSPYLRKIMRLVRTYAARGPAQVALLSAGARAQEQGERSRVAMAVVGGTFFGVVALSVLGNAAALPVAKQSGGFDVVGTAVAGVSSEDVQRSVTAAAAVVTVPHAQLPEQGYRVEDSDGKRMTVPYPVRLVAAEADLVSQQRFGLAAALPRYRTAAEALTAVITDGDKAVVDRFSRPEGAQPGDDVVLDLGAGPRRFRLVAVLDTFLLNGVIVGDAPFRELGLARGDTLLLARGQPGVAPAALRGQLERAAAAQGLEARTVQQAADDVVAVNRSFTDVFAVMLALALAIAVTSMAAGVVRSARERRGELGVLRALGLPRRSVVTLLAAEPVLVAVTGMVAGSIVGVVVLRVLFATGYSDLPFVLDAGRLLALFGLTSAVAVTSCVLAAWPAARRLGPDALADLG